MAQVVAKFKATATSRSLLRGIPITVEQLSPESPNRKWTVYHNMLKLPFDYRLKLEEGTDESPISTIENQINILHLNMKQRETALEVFMSPKEVQVISDSKAHGPAMIDIFLNHYEDLILRKGSG